MHEAHVRLLRRQATADPKTPTQWGTMVSAITELAQHDVVPIDWARERLLAAIENPTDSWDGFRASQKAAKVLSWIEDRLADQRELEYPSRTPLASADIAGGYWPYRQGDPMYGSPFEGPDSVDTQGVRDRHRRALFGLPPWRRGQPASSA
jgi:hypothetical protein